MPHNQKCSAYSVNSILIAYSNTFHTYNIVTIMISGCAAHPTQTFLPDYKNAALS